MAGGCKGRELKWEQVAGGLEEIRFFSAPGPPPGTPDWPRPEGMRSGKTTKRILAARFFSLDPSSGAEKMRPRYRPPAAEAHDMDLTRLPKVSATS